MDQCRDEVSLLSLSLLHNCDCQRLQSVAVAPSGQGQNHAPAGPTMQGAVDPGTQLRCINNNNNNNNNNTDICKAHIVSIRAESEAP